MLLLLIFGLVIYVLRPWLGVLFLAVGTALLLALSAPLAAYEMVAPLQRYPALAWPLKPRPDGPQAIVILGAGRYDDAPEYGGNDTVSAFCLERLRYGARLHRATRLPVLVSGGSLFGAEQPEAALMRDALVNDFGVPVRWLETRSRNTAENARYSAAMLHAAGIRRVYLVTHAWHMRRAVPLFEHAGLEVTPAPTGFVMPAREDDSVLGYLPSSAALETSALAMHERIGYFWARLRGEF